MTTTSATTNLTGSTRGRRAVTGALEGRFRIDELLRVSERASCYLAQETTGGRLVRLTVLSERAARSERQLRLFHLETQASAALSHPGIISDSQAEIVNGVHFCASAQAVGAEPLRDLIRRNGWLPPKQSVGIALQIDNDPHRLLEIALIAHA